MRMQKMPVSGKVTDKMKKMPMPYKGGGPAKRPEPTRVPGNQLLPKRGPRGPIGKPKQVPGGILERAKERLLPRRGPDGLGPKKKQAPGGMLEKRNEKLKKAYGSSMNSQKASPNYQNMQKAGPAANLRNIQKGNRPTLNRNKQAPNFKGGFQGLAKPKPRKTVPPRRGGR
jgi:hypothetical protein